MQTLKGNKRGMFDNLTGLALGIVIFAIMIGVGVVVLTKFGDTQAVCAEDYTYDAASQKCLNATDGDPTDPANTEWVTTNYLNTQLGSTGLAGWAPAIIALTVGLLFIGALTMKSRRY